MLVVTVAAKQASHVVNLMYALYFFGIVTPAILLGFINYFLVVFIDFCFNEGNILDFYYRWLLRLETTRPKLAKLLGICPICMGFWVGVGVYTLYWKYLHVHPIGFLGFIAVSQYLLIKRFTRE